MLTINSVQTQRMVGYLGRTVQVDLVRHGVRHLPDQNHLMVNHIHVFFQCQTKYSTISQGSMGEHSLNYSL